MNTSNRDFEQQDEAFAETLGKRLSQDADASLPPHISGRLRAARRAAMQPPTRSRAARPIAWASATAIAAVTVLLAVTVVPDGGVDVESLNQVSNAEAAQALELIAAAEDLEMFEQLDLLFWLEKVSGDDGVSGG